MRLLNLLKQTGSQEPINTTTTKIEVNSAFLFVIAIIGCVLLITGIVFLLTKSLNKDMNSNQEESLQPNNKIDANPQISQEVDNTTNTKQKNKRDKSLTWEVVIILISITIFIVVVPLFITTCKTNSSSSQTTNTTITTRKITENDYTCTTSQGLTSCSIILTPKLNINSCTILLELYNKEDKIIFTDTITKTDLKYDKSYTYNFEFGFKNSLSSNYVKYKVTGNCDNT